MISLRPVGGHAGIRRAAAQAGARVIALSPWRLEPRIDAATRRDLALALRAALVVFTSPVAVAAASALQAPRNRRGQQWFAVGSGSARALHRVGVAQVHRPARMDSEGLLALPALRDVRGRQVGLVTAPGGRDRIATVLRSRGANILRANVYERMPATPAATAVARLRALRARPWLALSSGEALRRVLKTLPVEALESLRRARVAAASHRLARLAREAGFVDIVVAASARPRDLLDAMVRAR